MKVVVDETLAILANLDALVLPDEVELPLLTTYAFQLRIAQAVVLDRGIEGRLQRLIAAYMRPEDDRSVLLIPETDQVRTLSPTHHVAAVARGKASWTSFIAAETVAAAEAENAEVRLSRGNAEIRAHAPGALRRALDESGVRAAVWYLDPLDDKTLRVVEAPLPDPPSVG